MADKGRRCASYEGDLTDGIRRAGRCHARSTAAPAEAEPGRAGSPVTVRLMTIGMGCRRCAAHLAEIYGAPRTVGTGSWMRVRKNLSILLMVSLKWSKLPGLVT